MNELDRKRQWLFDIVIRAGLAHVLSWAAVAVILDVLEELEDKDAEPA